MQKNWWRFGFCAIVVLVIVGVLLLAGERRERNNTGTINASDLLSEESAVSFCAVDSDCVPASCCHARACVAFSEKPECGGVRCTLSCEPGTLDCGQARCACIQKQCAMVPQ